MQIKSDELKHVPAMQLEFLHPRDITLIEEALKKVTPFGEVHLIVERGRLRFVRTIKSQSVDQS